jgi:hypothetical protein
MQHEKAYHNETRQAQGWGVWATGMNRNTDGRGEQNNEEKDGKNKYEIKGRRKVRRKEGRNIGGAERKKEKKAGRNEYKNVEFNFRISVKRRNPGY